MWIVSQNKLNIYNTDTMVRIANNGLASIRIEYANCDGQNIGMYSSPEKTQAVMKQIIDSQIGFMVMKNVDAEPDLKEALKEMRRGVISVKGENTEFNSIGNQVFFMPQDDEVIA